MPVSFCVINCINRFTIASGIFFFRFPESESKLTAWINAYSHEGVDAVRVFASLHSSLLVGYEANNYVSRIVLSERLKQP